MSTNRRTKTKVGIGISINHQNPPIVLGDSRSGTLRVLVAGRGEWTIDWAVYERQTMKYCQLGTAEKAHELFYAEYAEEIIYNFLVTFATRNWDSETTSEHPDDLENIATWEIENPRTYFSTSDLDEKTIKHLITICERTCKTRTEKSTGLPD
jgi:hypothetical protein